MFRGPEIIDTRAKLTYWVGQLSEEVAERLVRDQEENERVAKLLSVSLSLEGDHVSRSGPLFSYDPIKIKAQALQLHAKTNTLPTEDPNFRPKVRYVSISATKFEKFEAQNTSIQTFFKTAEKPLEKPVIEESKKGKKDTKEPEIGKFL